ncbi:hypothetical protein GCM10010466_55820 [Planomonospora alba]|uniref:glucan endo-1,3-beta-D-glucosidase n=1 Tax=Planomonospora alba TaxID=161354 RepID=A0ABP6NVI5_9ACTN
MGFPSPLRKVVAAAAVLATAVVTPVALAGPAAAVTVGAGGYAATRPAGTAGPSDSDGAAVTPKVTSRMAGRAVPTNDWWSSLVFQRYAGNPYSENMYAHPLSFHANAKGISVGYPNKPNISSDGRMYEYVHTSDLNVGVSGLNAPKTEVDGWGDWNVTPRWSDGTRTLRTTIAHGSPYVYAEVAGGNALVEFTGSASVWRNDGNVLGVTVNGRDYALFAPSGKNWSLTGTASASAPAAFFSVAVLPSRGALPLFTKYAYSFVTDTKVSWSYDAASARVRATYTASTTAKQGSQTGTLQALYRHQWRNSSDAVTEHRYVSPRGEMRLREGASFTTSAEFNGVLPALPLAPGADKAKLRAAIDAELNAADPYKGAVDTYWTGKALWRIAALIPVANQIGHTAGRDKAIGLVKSRLADWLTAGSGETGRLFAYDSTWKTLIGYPAGYGTDSELNDHHFHYGYYVLAGAMVAQHDPAWVSDSQYGGMLKLLVKDAANYDRSDERFPFLRNFDPYAGHAWASGHAGFGHGNNQESSSESMMFNTAAILFGQATGDTALRDAGIYLYTTEREAIGQYWFDVDGAVFPSSYGHDTAGMVWGAGASYSTWWTANAEEIHGINMLPITGGSLYNGAWKADIKQNISELRASNGGQESEWRDIIWQFLAMADPAAAQSLWQGAEPAPEDGDSRAHANHWITALNAWGTPDHSVTANVPTYAVLSGSAGRTYVAYNVSGSAVTVRFSDGQTLAVPARAMAWRGPAGSGTEPGNGSGPRPTASPTASPTVSPTASPTPEPTATPTSTPKPTVTPTAGGVDARSTIQAEDYQAQSGTVLEDTTDTGGGRNVGYIADGDWLRYDDVRFGSEAARQFKARVASGAEPGISGLVQVRLDSPTAAPIGDFAVANTGGWQSWRTIAANISGVTGTHTVYITFSSGQPAEYVNLNWFTFSSS